MLNIALIFLLFSVELVKVQNASHVKRDGTLVFVKEGDHVTITCHYQSEMAMHYSWYKHKLGQKPDLICTIYKYDAMATFYGKFKGNTRFTMVNEKGLTHLKITELKLSDSATYYCGSAHSNIVEFGEGTELVVRASQFQSLSVLQHPLSQPAQLGGSVILECTVFTQSCSAEHSVYWFRHETGESPPGIIYTHGNRSDECKRSSEVVSPTQSCVYRLPKRNLSLSDAGTYYCAVAMCGEIIFGNGTALNMNIKGMGCSRHLHILVLLSIVRISFLLCSVVVMILYCCHSSLHSRKSTKKNNLPYCSKNNCM